MKQEKILRKLENMQKKIKTCKHIKNYYIRIVFSDREYHYCINCFKKYIFEGVKRIEYVEKE
jgi:hypothetical protein